MIKNMEMNKQELEVYREQIYKCMEKLAINIRIAIQDPILEMLRLFGESKTQEILLKTRGITIPLHGLNFDIAFVDPAGKGTTMSIQE